MIEVQLCEKCDKREGDGHADVGTHDAWLCTRCYRTLNEEVFHPMLGKGHVNAPFWWFWRIYYKIADLFGKG